MAIVAAGAYGAVTLTVISIRLSFSFDQAIARQVTNAQALAAFAIGLVDARCFAVADSCHQHAPHLAKTGWSSLVDDYV